MIDFLTLDSETRCVALVGEFLRRWSNLESVLHDALAAAIGLDDTMRAILCANVQLRDKIHILRTIVGISTIGKSEKSSFDTTLVAIADYSPQRNLMAHVPFGPDDEGKGVLFLQVKAKGKFSQPKEVWTVDKFDAEYHKIDDFREQLSQLQMALSNSQFSIGNLYWTSAGISRPRRRTRSPTLGHLLIQPTPLPLFASQASPKKDDEILPKPLEKPDIP